MNNNNNRAGGLGMDQRVAFDFFRGGQDADDPLRQFLDYSVAVKGSVIISCSLDLASTDEAAFVMPEHRALFAHWSGLARNGDLPASADLDPLAFAAALGTVILLEPNADASDYRYRLYGTRVAEAMGRDLTGTWISQHPTAPAEVLVQQYAAATALRLCIYTENDAPDEVSHIIRWCRLIMPMVAPDNTVNRMLVGCVPVRKKD